MNNLFTSFRAYGTFSRGIKVGISLKKVVFICIFIVVLVVLVLLLVVKTLSPTMLFAWWKTFPKGLDSTCSVLKIAPASNSFNCLGAFLFLKFANETLCRKDFYFLFGVTQTCLSTWILLVWYFRKHNPKH